MADPRDRAALLGVPLLLVTRDPGRSGLTTGARPSRLLAVALALGYGAQIAWLGWIAFVQLG